MGYDSQVSYKNSVLCPTTWFCSPVKKVLTSKIDRFVPLIKIISAKQCCNSVCKKKKRKSHALLLYLRVRWTELGQGQKKGTKTLHYAQML